MRRVLVVGSAGAGKSTFADALGALVDLPVTHLDEHFWHPGWVETPRHEWREVQHRLVASDRWIIDGNYSATIDVRLARADTVVMLDMGRLRCLWRVLTRTWRWRGRERTAIGCPDRLDATLLRFVWTYPTRSRPKVVAAVEGQAPRVAFVRLGTPAAVRAYLAATNRTGRLGDDR